MVSGSDTTGVPPEYKSPHPIRYHQKPCTPTDLLAVQDKEYLKVSFDLTQDHYWACNCHMKLYEKE